MKTYFVTVILTALFGGICEELLPERASARLHLKLVTGLCVLAVLVLPAKDLLIGIGDFWEEVDFGALLSEESAREDYEELFLSSLSRNAGEEAGKYLAELIEEEFALSAETCRVTLYLSEDGSAERCLVYLSGTSVFQSPYEIEAYVNALLSCPCDVAVE